MTQQLLHEQAEQYKQNLPEIRAGHTVRVHERIQDEEGGKGRIQIFEGLVIGVHKGHTASDRTITVRRIASGVGVEKNFPLSSPVVEKIEVKKVAKVRRAKLNFLRGRLGKSARLSERFTTSGEFSIAAAPAPVKTETEETTEVPAEQAEKQEEKTEKKADKKKKE